MLSAAFLFSIGDFLPAFSWHSLLCLRKIKQKSAQYKARIRLNPNTRFEVKSTWFRHARWNTTRKRLMFLCSAFQTYVHLCGRMSKVYGKSLGMSPYVSLKISHISLISPISLINLILSGNQTKKVPDIITDVRDSTLKKRRPPTLPHCIAVPSAQAGLTSLFGMGRGGTPPQ